MGMSYVSEYMDSKCMLCDTYYGYASFLMIMNVIVLYEMRVINANLEYYLQCYLHSDFVL